MTEETRKMVQELKEFFSKLFMDVTEPLIARCNVDRYGRFKVIEKVGFFQPTMK